MFTVEWQSSSPVFKIYRSKCAVNSTCCSILFSTLPFIHFEERISKDQSLKHNETWAYNNMECLVQLLAFQYTIPHERQKLQYHRPSLVIGYCTYKVVIYEKIIQNKITVKKK